MEGQIMSRIDEIKARRAAMFVTPLEYLPLAILGDLDFLLAEVERLEKELARFNGLQDEFNSAEPQTLPVMDVVASPNSKNEATK